MKNLGRIPARSVLLAALALLLGLAVAAAPARAGSLDVNAAAASAGSFGLEVTPGSSCADPESVDLEGGSAAADVDACSFITARDLEVTGTVDFTAGISIALGNDFRVAGGSDFAAVLDNSLTRLAFVTDRGPREAFTYQARFRLSLDDLTIGAADKFAIFTGMSRDGLTLFEIRLHRNAAPPENRLTLRVRESDGSFVETPFGEEVMLPAGANLIEVDWRAGAGAGHFLVSVNGAAFGGLTRLDNPALLESVDLGATGGDVDSTAGSYYLDDFASFR